ncbi:MAG: hypothetical protein KDC98_07050 [Planctomycetes bacterium]|nr:hypothetical protein [Planctomycetota bacterium]
MRGRPAAGVVRDVIIVAIVTLLTFHTMRRFIGDYYRVPSRSMEPMLHGDPDDGDVVFVRSLAAAGDCRRNDLVVVRHPDDPSSLLVKRIAARGDDAECCLELREGDVWLGGDVQHLHREVKALSRAREMRVTWAQWPAGHGGVDRVDGLELAAATVTDDGLELPPMGLDRPALRRFHEGRADRRDEAGMPPRMIGTARVVDATYLDATGVRGREGEDIGIFDCGLEAWLVRPPETVVGILETRYETITFLWTPATGDLELWRDGQDIAHDTLPAITGAHRIEFGRLDDQLFFALDGRDDASLSLPRRAEWNPDRRDWPRGPRSHLYLGLLGSTSAELGRVVAFRDVYYMRERILGVPGQPSAWPVRVSPGHWFLLGDNAFDSRDSRSFREVSVGEFVGRPWFVLGPWPRQRWLTR